MILRKISVRSFPGISEFDIDFTTNDEGQYFHHSDQKLSNSFLIDYNYFATDSKSEVNTVDNMKSLNHLFWLIFNLPSVTSINIGFIFQEIDKKDELISFDIEYYKNRKDKNLNKYSCRISNKGFVFQKILRKERSSIDSMWISDSVNTELSDLCIIPKEDYASIIYFSPSWDESEDSAIDLLGNSRYKNYLKIIKDSVSGSNKSRLILIKMLRSMGVTDYHSNGLVSEIDATSSDSIMIKSSNSDTWINLADCSPKYIKSFLLIALTSVCLYSESSIIIVDKIDKILGVRKITRFFHNYLRLCSKEKTQLISCFESTSKLEAVVYKSYMKSLKKESLETK